LRRWTGQATGGRSGRDCDGLKSLAAIEMRGLLCGIDRSRLRPLDPFSMRYEEGADGLVPPAQSLRGYECAGRKRTFTNPDPMGDGIKNRSAQNLKTSPVILTCSAKGIPELSQEAAAFLFSITNFILFTFFRGAISNAPCFRSDAMMFLL
jgi:hypothetical protein